jgi:hypothetical protein
VKLPEETYDLDTEITKYGGRAFRQAATADRRIEGANPATPQLSPARRDLDSEIAKWGGRSAVKLPAHAMTDDPLAALRQSDPLFCQQVEAFGNAVGASLDLVVPRGTPDPRMANGVPWPQWERRRLGQIFNMGRTTIAEMRSREEKGKAERAAWQKQWRTVQHGWAKWMHWWLTSPAEAEEYRGKHEDGTIDWLLDLAAQRALLRKRRTKRGA